MTLLSDLAQRVVARPELALRRHGIVGQRDEPEVDRRQPDRVAELVDRVAPPLQQLERSRLVSLHRLDVGEHGEHGRLQDRLPLDIRKQRLTARGSLPRRGRAEHQGHAQPFDDLAQLERVADSTGVLERVLRSLRARRRLAAEVVRLRREPPRSREPEVVAAGLEDGDRTFGDHQQLRRA